jgi:hypothetical protein
MNPASSPAPRKFGSTILIVALLGGVVGLGVWAMRLQRDLGVAREELAVASRRTSAFEDNLQKENRTLHTQVAMLEGQLTTANAAVAAATAAAQRAPAPAAAPAPANPLAAIATLANNPALRNSLLTSQRRSIETRYAELFTILQFTPEQRTRFVDMLTELQAPIMEASLKMLGGNMTSADQAAMRKQAAQIEADSEAKIREFLGDDAKFATYKQFNEQQTERTQLTAFRTSLARSNVTPLSPEQSAALSDIMYTERKSFRMTPTNNGDSANPLAPSAEAVATRVREQGELNERIATRAATVLNTEQLATLRQDQAARLESLKASGDLARQLLGGAQPAAK